MADDWTEPGAHAVARDVYRLPIPLPGDGLKAVNVYVLVDSASLTLIDAGWVTTESRRALEHGLAELGADLRDVNRFLVTHVHRDHYTQAIAIRREFGTHVSIGVGESHGLELACDPSWSPSASHVDLLRRHGAQELLSQLVTARVLPVEHHSGEWEMPDDWISDGHTLALAGHSLVARQTPGHTRGHVVFIDPDQQLLFAGDHVLPRITPAIGFEPEAPENPLRDYLRSLALVRSWPDMMLLPAHGPVTDSVHERVDQLLDHHDTRLAETLEAVRGRARTGYEVARELAWTSRRRRFDDLDLYNRLLALIETVHHLVLLVERQEAVLGGGGGVARFRPR